jgi:hypothetical protein
MHCTIDKYQFELEDETTIVVTYNNGLSPVATLKLTDKITTQKGFEIECSDWYMKNVR